jgi:hypothetical protein
MIAIPVQNSTNLHGDFDPKNEGGFERRALSVARVTGA